MLQKCALAQEIRLGSPDRFSSGEGGVWGRDYGIVIACSPTPIQPASAVDSGV